MSVRVRCNCGYHMELPDDWAGRQGRCPQCSKVLHIPAKKSVGPVVSPPAMTVATPQVGPQIDVATESDKSSVSSGTPLVGMLRSPAWLAAIVGGVALLGIGLFLVLRAGGSSESDGKSGGSADNRLDLSQPGKGQGSEVFRPIIQPGELEKRPKGDIESVDVGQPKVATSKMPDTPEPRTKTPAGPVTLENWGLRDFGVAIPPGASVVEVDGVALPVRNPTDLAGQDGVPLVLPYGKHIVRFARTDPPRVVEPKRWFLDAYRAAATQVQEGGRWSFDRLLELSRRSLDRFTEPLVPHLWGNFYWQEGQHDAAIRHYTWALEIAPTFAPSYFNLAQLEHERGDDDVARRYLRLADLWNAQNTYGLSNALNVLRTTLAPGEPAHEEDEPDWFVADHGTLTPRDQDMMAVLRSAAEFAPRATERAKILNNLGAYFEYVGKPELALESYRTAASVLGAAKLENEERRVIQGILENLARVCRKADMPEYRRYERLQAMVQ